MNDVVLVLLPLLLCGWIAWLEWRLKTLHEERDVLCEMLVGLAYGRLRVEINPDKSVSVKPMGDR